MKKKQQKNLRLLLVFLFGAISLLLIFRIFDNYSKQNSFESNQDAAKDDSKTTSSDLLKISFIHSQEFEVTVHSNAIFLKNKLGEIRITRQGTNYNNLEDYLNSLGSGIQNRDKLEIGGLPTVKGIIDDTKYYFLYADNWVYSLSTASPVLYDDLDQIAGTFRYVP